MTADSAPYAFRWEPCDDDCIRIREILEGNGIFYPYEVDVAIELIEDRLERGTESDYTFIFLDDDEGAVGYICFGPIYMTDNRFDLYWIAVREELRGQGLGKLLLEEAEKRIRNLGGQYLYVETSGKDDYRKTRAFYVKQHYDEVARIPHFYKDNDDKIIFMKKMAD